MEETVDNKLRLVEDIKRDAETEAARIREETGTQAKEREAQVERQIEAIRAEADAAAKVQTDALRKGLKAAFAVELKRITLRSRDQVFKRILDRVEEKLAEHIGGSGYRRVLLGLIVEAVVGLGAERAEVNASPRELALIDEKLLREAEAKVKELILRTVKIEKSQAAPLLLQGIVMSAEDGKTAYNNQIRTRLLRNQSGIRKLMYERLRLQ